MQPKNQNLSKTSESESKNSEKPIPGDKPESIVEPPAEVTKQKAAKQIKKQKLKK
jgi:hypothetical protein